MLLLVFQAFKLHFKAKLRLKSEQKIIITVQQNRECNYRRHWRPNYGKLLKSWIVYDRFGASMGLEDNRREYDYGNLTRESLLDDPFSQFDLWINQAIESQIQDPTAMSLSTVNAEGKPWQRMVLLKHFDTSGFVFYTNTASRKASEIDNNPHVSLHFPWLQLDRQVIVGGKAEHLSTTEVVKYFLSRPQGSQLAAWASKQSSVISSRQVLEQQFNKIKQKFADGQVPLPDFWGGYRVVPTEIEFWQGGENRLHDRFSYQLNGDSWEISRLSP